MKRKPVGDRIEILVREDWHCWFCGDVVNGRPRVGYLQPPGEGGAATPSNLRAMCVRCCARKGGRTVEQFRELVRRTTSPEAALAWRLRTELATSQLAPTMAGRVKMLIDELEQAAPPLVFFGEREDATKV